MSTITAERIERAAAKANAAIAAVEDDLAESLRGLDLSAVVETKIGVLTVAYGPSRRPPPLPCDDSKPPLPWRLSVNGKQGEGVPLSVRLALVPVLGRARRDLLARAEGLLSAVEEHA